MNELRAKFNRHYDPVEEVILVNREALCRKVVPSPNLLNIKKNIKQQKRLFKRFHFGQTSPLHHRCDLNTNTNTKTTNRRPLYSLVAEFYKYMSLQSSADNFLLVVRQFLLNLLQANRRHYMSGFVPAPFRPVTK